MEDLIKEQGLPVNYVNKQKVSTPDLLMCSHELSELWYSFQFGNVGRIQGGRWKCYDFCLIPNHLHHHILMLRSPTPHSEGNIFEVWHLWVKVDLMLGKAQFRVIMGIKKQLVRQADWKKLRAKIWWQGNCGTVHLCGTIYFTNILDGKRMYNSVYRRDVSIWPE